MFNFEKLTDRLNPLLIREIRQSLRSSVFAAGIVIVSLLSAFFLSLFIMDRRTADGGAEIFRIIFFVLWIFACVVVPFCTARRFRDEKKSGEFELVIITGISPFALVSGKLQAALIQVLIILFTAAPFMMSCYLLKGITVAEELVFILFLVASSAFLVMCGIFSGAFKGSGLMTTIADGAFLIGMIICTCSLQGLFYHSSFLEFVSSWPDLFFCLILYGYYMAMLLFGSVVMLDFQGRNNELNLKISILAGLLFLPLLQKIPGLNAFKLTPGLSIFMIAGIPSLIVALILPGPIAPSLPYITRKWAAVPLVLKAVFYPGRGALMIWFSLCMLILMGLELYMNRFSFSEYSSFSVVPTYIAVLAFGGYVLCRHVFRFRKVPKLAISLGSFIFAVLVATIFHVSEMGWLASLINPIEIAGAINLDAMLTKRIMFFECLFWILIFIWGVMLFRRQCRMESERL